MTYDEKVNAMKEGIERLEKAHGFFSLEVDFSTLAVLIAHVQLALRHPANKGHSAKVATDMIHRIIAILGEREPVIGELLRLGFDPSHDVEVARGQ